MAMMNSLDLPGVALGFAQAAGLGFLIGRTREPAGGPPVRAGLRDFVLIACLGAAGSQIGQAVLTVTMAAAVTAILVAARFAAGGARIGVTTELAALATFLLGYLSMTPGRTLAALLGILLSFMMATKEQLHRFALETISQREFEDTLKFLALIFVVFPLLPAGEFGPFGLFNPRKVWVFVILVSTVSYAGYFLARFLDPARGLALTAIVGGLASTTAFTGGVAKMAAETPGAALALVRAACLGNAVQYPRLLLLLAVISPALAIQALPMLAAMTGAGLLAAWWLGRSPRTASIEPGSMAFRNPFALVPALRFGAVFALILFGVRAAQHYFGAGGLLLSAGVGGLIDVDAVLLSLTEFFRNGIAPAPTVVGGILLGAAANAVFKSMLAATSRQPAFYLRLWIGFAAMLGCGVAAFLLAIAA